MSKMLNVKDLITVGIFAVILTVSIFIFGMLGYIPVSYTHLVREPPW